MTDNTSNPRVTGVLQQLEGRIKKYVVIEGAALVVALVCLLFWLSLGLDVAYFWLSKLELPQWFRAGYGLVSIAAVVTCVLTYLVFRLARSFRAKALALVLERRFPELDDRLVTAVEMAARKPGEAEHDTVVTRALLDRTIANAGSTAEGLDLSNVFATKPMRLATTVAVLLLVATVAYGATNGDALNRWAEGFIGLEEEYWNRKTDLRVKVLLQPGDLVRDFRDEDGLPTGGRPGTYKHPRGSDVTLLVIVPEGENAWGEPWKIPESDPDVRFRQDNGTRGTNRAVPIKDQRLLEREKARAIFKVTRPNVQAGLDVTVTGGDFTNRRPYRVEVVEPPRLDQIVLDCEFPAYTHWNEIEGRSEQLVAGTKHTLPAETRFVLRSSTNKPIVAARVEFGDTELVFGEMYPPVDPTQPVSEADRKPVFRAERITRSEDGANRSVEPLPADVARSFIDEDGKRLRVPFLISSATPDLVHDRTAEPIEGLGQPFHLEPGTKLRIRLTDEDGIESVDPSELTIGALEDRAPELQDLALNSIGRRVTRMARIPFAGRILDDYGTVVARFEYRILDRETEAGEPMPDEGGEDASEPVAAWRPRPFRDFPVDDEPRDFALNRPIPSTEGASSMETFLLANDSFEKFDVLPLDLSVGQRLVVTVYARDGDDLNGPHETRSGEFVFEIVDEEDLFAFLYVREVDLLGRIKKLVGEIERSRAELEEARPRSVDFDRLTKDESDDAARLASLERSLQVVAERTLYQARTSAGELEGVRISFAEIVQELLNNNVDKRPVEHMVQVVYDPIRRCTERHFPDLDRAAGLFRLNVEEKRPTAGAVEGSLEAIDTLLSELEGVVSELNERVNYLRAIRNLKTILEDEEAIRKQTEEQQKRDLIKGLDGLGLDD